MVKSSGFFLRRLDAPGGRRLCLLLQHRRLCWSNCPIWLILLPGISNKFVLCLVLLRKSNTPLVFWCYCISTGDNMATELVSEACSSSLFFQCEDQKVEILYDTLKRVSDSFSQCFPPSISLALHSSTSYLGFFVDDSHANILKEFAVAFSSEASALAGRINIREKIGGL